MNPKQFSCTPTWQGMYGEEQGRVTVSSLWHTKSAQKMRQLTSSRGCGWWLWGVFTPCSPNSTCYQILEARWHCHRWRGHTGQSWGRNTWRRMQKAGNRWTARASTMVCCDGRVQDGGLQYMATFMLFCGSVSTAMVKKCQKNYDGQNKPLSTLYCQPLCIAQSNSWQIADLLTQYWQHFRMLTIQISLFLGNSLN